MSDRLLNLIRRCWRQLVGVVLLVLLIGVIGPRVTVATLEAARLEWLALCAAMLVLCGLIGAINVYLLGEFDKIRFRVFCRVFWHAWAVHLVSPGQVGDVAAISLMMRRHGVSWSASLGRLMIDKVISLLVISGFALAGYLYLVSTRVALTDGRGAEWIALAAAFSVAVMGWFVVTHPQRLQQLRELVFSAWSETRLALKERARQVGLNCVLTVIKTLLSGSAVWAVFIALGYSPPYWPSVFLVMSASVVAYVPVSINGIGTVEAVAIQLFAGLGVSAEATLLTFIVYRAIILAVAWIPSALMLLLDAEKNDSSRSSPGA